MIDRSWLVASFIPATVIVAPAFATDYLTVAQAQRALFPQAETFVDHKLTLDDDQKDRIKKLAGVRQRWDEQPVWSAEAGDEHLGWVIVDEVVGKHEFITYAAALSPDGKVLGVEIMSYRETHGGQIREAEWRQHLVGKTLDDPFKLDRDVPNISGATLSCRNVMDGVKRLLALQQVALRNE